MIRVYLIIAAALALAGALYHDHLGWQKLKAARAELADATATIKAEREQRRKQDEATQRVDERKDKVAADRHDNPLPAVVVGVRRCPRMPSAPVLVAQAAEANDAPADAGDSDTSAGTDIGPALDDFATDAEMNLAQCEELMRFVGKE